MPDDDYKDTPVIPAVKSDAEGVHFYNVQECFPDCDDFQTPGEMHIIHHSVYSPEMAREIAFNLTKASFECEDMERE